MHRPRLKVVASDKDVQDPDTAPREAPLGGRHG